MAKMRVHELAKELEINSKDIIEALAGTEFEVKAASSNVDDEAQELVRKKFKKSSSKAGESDRQEAVAPAVNAAAKTSSERLTGYEIIWFSGFSIR